MSTPDVDRISEWHPGDGLTCSRIKQASRDVPCGPPVAVYTTPIVSYGPRRGGGQRKYVVCANHLPIGQRPAEIAIEARKAATERLVVDNWDEYQRLVQEFVDKAVTEQAQQLPESLRRLVTGEVA